MELVDTLFGSPVGPLLIFVLSAINVTLMTMRQIVAVRGYRAHTALLGFFQMLFWLVAVGGALGHLDSVLHVLGYASGYAAGCYAGITLERHLAIGTSVVDAVFSPPDASDADAEEAPGPMAVRRLREQDFAAVETPARGWQGDAHRVRVVVPRRKVEQVMATVEREDPDAFIAVEGVEATRGGYPQGPADAPERGAPPWSPRGLLQRTRVAA